jgi:hypothetical protein
LKLFDCNLGARIAFARELGGFGYERLQLRLHLLRLLHRRVVVALERDQLIPLEYQRHGLKTKPDKQGHHGESEGKTRGASFGGLGFGRVIFLICLDLVFHKSYFAPPGTLGSPPRLTP